jgi:uncharacterized protein YdhG (YjbR/CyaY superfamily)
MGLGRAAMSVAGLLLFAVGAPTRDRRRPERRLAHRGLRPPEIDLEDTVSKTDFKSVDEYIATHPEDMQAILQRVRHTIREAVPGADEVISYQIPAYKLHGYPVLYFAGWKQHYSLYPATDHVVEAFKDDLAAYKVNRGTIRFPLAQPVPVKLIERIAKFRAKEAAEGARAKPNRALE